jgi:hypothetical protein
MKQLLTFQNAKTTKGESLGYLTGILYMAPATLVDGINVCPFASEGCKTACLYSAGRGRFSNVQAARIAKTKLWRDNKQYFFECLKADIERLIRKAKRDGLIPVVRLNGTSDIAYETYKVYNGLNIFELFSDIQFYDYTKNYTRFDNELPSNYHLTFSWSEVNHDVAIELLSRGVNVAVVFDDAPPSSFYLFNVVDGDKHDLRFLDLKGGYVVGLKAKGDAKKDVSGFTQKAA